MGGVLINKDVVKLAMIKNNIATQTELAERLGMSKSQLSQMLSDEFCPIKTNVINLLEELKISFNELIGIESNEQLELPLMDNSNLDNISRFDYKLNEFIDVKDVTPVNKYTVLETFAGAGGLALGLEQAGLNSVGAIEMDTQACNTLKKNRPNWNIIKEDIIEVANKGIRSHEQFVLKEELDVLSGGYPCQSFSYAGKRHGLEDIRGTLFYPYSQILHDLRPKVFIAENVKGLVNHDNGRTLETMLDVFMQNNYTVYWNVLNAWNYDVAQKRERIVIVGIRNDLVEKQIYPFAFPEVSSYKPVLRDVLKNVPDSLGTPYSEKKKKVLELVPQGGCWINLPEKVAKEYMGASYNSGGGRRGMARRISWDEPSLTLTTSPSQKQTERCHPEETRPFTTREYARIQSFPDDWKFEGSSSNIYKQIGNAVPVNLAKYVGLSVVNYLNQFK
ncbi:DNA (cytosine-5-)-methyltransferase [Carnobacterium divergens]|uniref:Cytosine-specific methyltransferase n=1 Tax=Carnobacterium divergens DSM 20623 TaxID=1449336 RepID=A0A0R2I659_CARDV|nr:DNA (cytosine-5-)-methyltransferase [Carnobacterium divergens]KRN57756.1 modification methylase HaeIII [Carnobacterium divergens DSM 20623]MDO0874384.1 DNA (cytosine-5-)-methyltransferase [Carnobacterium divergens]SUX21739.1 Modification methylase HhaI [Carnobacterium divergens]